MGEQERVLKEYKVLRDAAQAVFQTDLDLVRSEFTPKAIAQRVGEKAAAMSGSATDAVKRHRGTLIGGSAAVLAGTLAFWLTRVLSQGKSGNDMEGDNDEEKEIS